MSKQLLQYLNRNRNGAFHQWLNEFEGEPRIAWYPSAGMDFRDLMYLHPDFPELMDSPPNGVEPACPDIFLHTDYLQVEMSPPVEGRTIDVDTRSSVYFKSVEELAPCYLPLDDQIVHFSDGGSETGRVFFMEVEINSHIFGKFSRPVVYAHVENTAFCAKRVLPLQGNFSHVIHVRYGSGFGGSASSGGWLVNVLKQLKCECFLTDGHHHLEPGDKRIYDLYAALAPHDDTAQLDPIRIIPSQSWSCHGDASWNVVN